MNATYGSGMAIHYDRSTLLEQLIMTADKMSSSPTGANLAGERPVRVAWRPADLLGWIGIVGVVSLMTLIGVVGFVATGQDQTRLNQARLMNRELRLMLISLVDAETGVRGFLLTGKVEYLEPYEWGMRALQTLPPALTAEVDAFAKTLPNTAGEHAAFSDTLGDLRGVWSDAIRQAESHDLAKALATLESMRGKILMDGLRADIGGFIATRDGAALKAEHAIDVEENWVLLLNLLGGAAAISALVYAARRSARDSARRDRAVGENIKARNQIERLFVMAEMLQSATDREDANEVLRASAAQLLPGLGGALYVFNNSRDRLDLSTTWSGDGSADAHSALPDHITPNSCWALKRGKPHRNTGATGALRCAHALAGQVTLEIPMAARGELYGLLELTATGADAEARMADIQLIAGALADAMSLALSSISLRERLRNQALRDPLTGLYNRRFLEEMIERLAHDAERKRTPLAALMLDLDHFKTLNDQFGHATGDAVLRQVSNTIMANLRATDVACRYGGEELAILMPDTSLEAAVAKAEQIRAAIADMSRDGRVPPVAASIGVASTPETASRATDLIAAADAALYLAKQQGRDRVVAGTSRGAGTPKLVLAE